MEAASKPDRGWSRQPLHPHEPGTEQDDYMGIAEIAEFIEYSKQYTNTLSKQKHFPDPITSLSQGRVWKTKDIEEWAEAFFDYP